MRNAIIGLWSLAAMELLILLWMAVRWVLPPLFLMGIAVAATACGLTAVICFGLECKAMPVLTRYITPSQQKRLIR